MDTQHNEIQESLERGEKREIDAEDDSNKKLKVSSDVDFNASNSKDSCPKKNKLKMMAMLLAYSGKDYLGMQRNPGIKTVEEELMLAMLKANVITQDQYAKPQLIRFQRAARTDKGVSAIRQIVSLKLQVQSDFTDVVEKINSYLPIQIRVIDIKRATRGFNSKTNCDSRTYSYMLPTFAFASSEVSCVEDYRIPMCEIEAANKIFELYKGSHNFHNFTSGRKANDPSCRRYILSCQCSDPFVKDGLEFAVIKVKGQSFMLHQIRKMIGLVIAIARNLTTVDTMKKAWELERIDIPIAPGLGLMLEEVCYDRYNKRYGKDGLHNPLLWDDYQDILSKFQNDYIYPIIVETEKNDKVMLKWLETLPFHSYDVRIPGPPIETTKHEVHVDKNSDSTNKTEISNPLEENL